MARNNEILSRFAMEIEVERAAEEVDAFREVDMSEEYSDSDMDPPYIRANESSTSDSEYNYSKKRKLPCKTGMLTVHINFRTF